MKGLHQVVEATQKQLFDRSVPGIAQSSVDLKLPKGPGKAWHPEYIETVRFLVTFACWAMITVSVAVGFFHIKPRNLLSSPGILLFSLIIAAAISAGMLLLVSHRMSAVGELEGTRKVGTADDPYYQKQLKDETVGANALMGVTWASASYIEYLALSNYLLNKWNPSSHDYPICIIGGCAIAAMYVLGIRAAWYKSAYNKAAQQSIHDYQMDVYRQLKVSSKAEHVPLQEADRALGAVGGLLTDITLGKSKLDQDFESLDRKIAAEKSKLTPVPTAITQEEKDAIRRLEADLATATQRARFGGNS